jgi:pimeloyl-ACP methyl ester carboxylesterase
LHGIGADGRTFHALATAMDRPDLLSLNLPGYAGEPGLPENFEMLKDWLGSKLPQNPSVLIGHSIGGMLALDFALDHPDRVAGLVLVCTTPAFGGLPQGAHVGAGRWKVYGRYGTRNGQGLSRR